MGIVIWAGVFVSGLILTGASSATAVPAAGPLRVSALNPRYFTNGSGKAIYLTGSHHWNNLQDSGKVRGPLTNPFDYVGYLDLLSRFNHNFMRMWSWEGGENEVYYAPLPYRRTGPGTALDGEPRFDMNQFNQEYFERLRSRVVAARDRGIYVSIMLFQGWSIYNRGYGNPWPIHPFNEANNINGINADANGDGEGKEVHTLQVPAVTRLQEAYIRKVIDTVNDLHNVLYEITNETAIFSKDWQYHVIKYIKAYEAAKPKQHPVGMTYFDSGGTGAMDALFASPADWISPGGQDYRADPPPATGAKVILNDTDHLWGVGGDSRWVWKCFLRGLNPIYMDPLPGATQKPWMSNTEAERQSARRAMGHTRAMADRMNLATMAPRKDLASSGYCLANPGVEYLVYLPDGGEVTVDLTAAGSTFAVEWMHPVDGTITPGKTSSGGDKRTFKAPFSGNTVLYIRRKPR